MAVAVMMLTGCHDYDEEVVVSGDPVRVELAYTFSSSVAGNQTRQADALVQNSIPRKPDPSNLFIIAMEDEDFSSSEIVLKSPVYKSGESDKPASYLYHSYYCNIAPGVNGCLVYGSVADETPSSDVDLKVYNGYIKPSADLSSVKTQDALLDFTFSLESIWDNKVKGVPEGARTVASYLTAVANAKTSESEGSLYWKNSKNEILKNLFNNFTNHENNLPGSEVAVKKWLEMVVATVEYYLAEETRPAAILTNEENILKAIKTAANEQIDNIESKPTNYPRNIHLPDGAAVLRWVRSTTNGDAFQPRLENTTIDNINGISRFAYPAALYYFVDGSLKTSNSSVAYYATDFDGVTTDASKTAWDKVLEEFNDGSTVTASTKSVAIVDPVQYAVAQLQVTVKAATATLQDATTPTAKDITVGSESFPLKGIIVGGQRPLNYRFEPVNSDVDTKFIYDSQVQKSGDTPYYMTTSEPTGGPSTLVFQSRFTEDVDIILEFENDSGEDFEGVNGTVYKGTRFYLIGRVTALTEEEIIDSQEETKQVFTKDYITKVNMIVSSLAKAYSVLPSLLSNNLEIGVEATPQWVAATPTVIRLE